MESRNKVVESSDHIFLPEEIVESILSRLPVKSLFRFRCASKSCCYLIGSKRFIQMHLENSRKNTSLARHRIIMKTYSLSSPRDNLKHCSLSSLMNNLSTCTYAFDDPFVRNWVDSYEIVGCCNGLICFLGPVNEFFLWNPSTRLSNKLPDIKLKGGYIATCGFGFDERKDDYKIIAVLKFGTQQQRNKKKGRIYSLKSNSWIKIRMPKMDVSRKFLEGKFVNGKLHWLRLKYTKMEWEAVSFDLESQQRGIVQLPCPAGDTIRPSLVEVEGCLGMFVVDPSRGMDVWIMKEYGVKESWSKVRSICCDSREGNSLCSELLHIGETGELLLICQFKFIVHNLKDCVFPLFPDVPCYPHVYTKSLVSPFPGKKRHRRM